jgi:ribosome biogenesis protein Tsr3
MDPISNNDLWLPLYEIELFLYERNWNFMQISKKNKSYGIVVQQLVDSLECKQDWWMVKQIKKTVRECGWHRIWNTRPQFIT